jgi:hypothetical protein
VKKILIVEDVELNRDLLIQLADSGASRPPIPE